MWTDQLTGWQASPGMWPILRNHNPAQALGVVKAEGGRLIVEFITPMRLADVYAVFGRPGLRVLDASDIRGEMMVSRCEVLHFNFAGAQPAQQARPIPPAGTIRPEGQMPAASTEASRTALGNCQDALQAAIGHLKVIAADDTDAVGVAEARQWLRSIGA